jgi:hypothetical protein
VTASASFRDVALIVRRAHEGGAFDEALAEHELAVHHNPTKREYGSAWRRYRRKCQTIVISVLGWRGDALARLTAELVVDRFLEKGVLLGEPRDERRDYRWKAAGK